MFKTHESVEVNFYGLFGEPESRYWRLVERNMVCPWFCVSVVQADEDFDLQRTLMPGDIQMLEHILSQQADDVVVTDVLVMMPHWMTGSDRWTLERLIELRSGFNSDNTIVNFYVTEGGKVYHDFCHIDGHVPRMIKKEEAKIIYQRKQA